MLKDVNTRVKRGEKVVLNVYIESSLCSFFKFKLGFNLKEVLVLVCVPEITTEDLV